MIINRVVMLVAVLLLAAGYADAASPTVNNADARPRIGMNPAGPADWNTELPFVDVFRLSSPWIGQKQGAGWGQGRHLNWTSLDG